METRTVTMETRTVTMETRTLTMDNEYPAEHRLKEVITERGTTPEHTRVGSVATRTLE